MARTKMTIKKSNTNPPEIVTGPTTTATTCPVLAVGTVGSKMDTTPLQESPAYQGPVSSTSPVAASPVLKVQTKPCPPEKPIFNPESGRCVKNPPVKKRLVIKRASPVVRARSPSLARSRSPSPAKSRKSSDDSLPGPPIKRRGSGSISPRRDDSPSSQPKFSTLSDGGSVPPPPPPSPKNIGKINIKLDLEPLPVFDMSTVPFNTLNYGAKWEKDVADGGSRGEDYINKFSVSAMVKKRCPFMKTSNIFADDSAGESGGNPVSTPLIQLLAVIPPPYLERVVPNKTFIPLLKDPSSDLSTLAPTAFDFFVDGKRAPYQIVPILPDIDMIDFASRISGSVINRPTTKDTGSIMGRAPTTSQITCVSNKLDKLNADRVITDNAIEREKAKIELASGEVAKLKAIKPRTADVKKELSSLESSHRLYSRTLDEKLKKRNDIANDIRELTAKFHVSAETNELKLGEYISDGRLIARFTPGDLSTTLAGTGTKQGTVFGVFSEGISAPKSKMAGVRDDGSQIVRRGKFGSVRYM